jgi:[acyl-carrier-protein] S-malonyltransferase
MGVSEAECNPAAAALFKEAQEILGYDLLALCKTGLCALVLVLLSMQCTLGPLSALSETNVCQPAMFVCDLVAVEKLRRESPSTLATW